VAGFWDCVFAKRTPDGIERIRVAMTAMFSECGASQAFIAAVWDEILPCLASIDEDNSIKAQCTGESESALHWHCIAFGGLNDVVAVLACTVQYFLCHE
jgi:hypothetical protein